MAHPLRYILKGITPALFFVFHSYIINSSSSSGSFPSEKKKVIFSYLKRKEKEKQTLSWIISYHSMSLLPFAETLNLLSALIVSNCSFLILCYHYSDHVLAIPLFTHHKNTLSRSPYDKGIKFNAQFSILTLLDSLLFDLAHSSPHYTFCTWLLRY